MSKLEWPEDDNPFDVLTPQEIIDEVRNNKRKREKRGEIQL